MRLIAARQVVLLYDNGVGYLFYHGNVYVRSMSSDFGDVPTPQPESYRPIWALIDPNSMSQGPPVPYDLDVWPIQASRPDRVLWNSWRKQLGAALFGMPLWNTEDLLREYAFSSFSLSTTNPGHVIRSRFVPDRLSSLQVKIRA